MSQLLGFWTRHHKKIYVVLGALAVIGCVIVAVYVWRKSQKEEDQGSENTQEVESWEKRRRKVGNPHGRPTRRSQRLRSIGRSINESIRSRVDGMSERHERRRIIVVVVVLLILSFLPVIPEPYYHEDRVCFWVWLWREIDELQHGERA